MNKYMFLASLFFLLGIILLFYGFILNEVDIGFFIIFPLILASSPFSIFGVFLIFISILFLRFEIIYDVQANDYPDYDESNVDTSNK